MVATTDAHDTFSLDSQKDRMGLGSVSWWEQNPGTIVRLSLRLESFRFHFMDLSLSAWFMKTSFKQYN